MAATDKTYRNQKTLDIVFAVSCILMLLCTLWMLVADYNREYKTVQRTFRDVESALNERQMLAQLPNADEVKDKEKVIEEKRQAVDKAKEGVRADDQRLTAERDNRTATYRSIKADFDSKTSFYNIEISERDQAGIRPEVRKERAERVEARKQELDKLQKDLDDAQKALDATEAEYKEKVTKPVSETENQLADAENDLKKTTASFDRFAKLTVQKEWGLGDAFRALPILDAFESPTKIKQIVLADLPIEYGSFKYVTRYDRCTSCHLAVDRGAFDHDTLTKLTRGPKEAEKAWKAAALATSNDLAALIPEVASEGDQKKVRGQLLDAKTVLDAEDRAEFTSSSDKPDDPYAVVNSLKGALRTLHDCDEVVETKSYGPLDREIARVKDLTDQLVEIRSLGGKLETAQRILRERKTRGEALGFEPGDLPSQAQTVSLTPGQVTQYAVHPRLDLFVDSNSPHPMEKFGCTVCHGGQGSATDFQLADHTPADADEQKKWENAYHWHSSHDWEFPMLSNRFVESSCLQCHHEVTDLVRKGNQEEAPKLLRGFNLVRENGCFGCHEIASIKKGQAVGPDLRLESTPPLDWLSPTEQDRAKADPTNPPGTYRKVGPSLRRIAEKTNEEWARRWIQSPRGFRPDTKMPHFYNLSTNSPDVLPDDQKDFPAAEIHSIAHYLFTESADHLQGKDFYRLFLQSRLEDLQKKLAEKDLDDKDAKELADVTRKLTDLALLSIPAHSGEINALGAKLKENQDLARELYEKVHILEGRIPALKQQKDDLQKKVDDLKQKGGKPEDAVKKAEADAAKTGNEMDQAAKDRDAAKQELDRATKDLRDTLGPNLETAALPIPLEKQVVDAEGVPVPGDLPAGDKARGRKVFSERGCLACHVHEAVRTAGDGVPAVDAFAANFGPDLSRVAEKIKGDDKARRRWVMQWVLNPNIHHPRTRMPITHLTVQQAADVAEWLLSQQVKPEELADWTNPQNPEAKTLVALARVYLAKAPGMTSKRVDDILPADAADQKTPLAGYPKDELQYVARDADEQKLAGPIPPDQLADRLQWYIGKKSISRLGCYACHDVPGFETAKPIGTALNDWGKKDAERLAFEDADVYVRKHYNIVEARDAAGNPGAADADWHAAEGKPPYEKVFADALEHHTREGFLHQKLEEPRSYDYNRIRAWDDRLRMPQFKFARARRRPDETDEAYANRSEREEAEAREAVMTFILGLVAEPIPLKYVAAPGPDRLAEAKGRQLLEKYNCVGCHQVRPGVYEFRPSKESIDALESVYQAKRDENEKTDHVFLGHNAWTGVGSPWPDRLVAYGTQAKVGDDGLLSVRLTDALRFANNDRVVRDIPAAIEAKVIPEDVISQSPPLGGAFTDLMIPYVAQVNSNFKEADTARSVLPPPLSREGERVQPKWLYQFLLDPQPVRPPQRMFLRMPKFNMGAEDAMTLVNYFGSVDKLSNPGAGVTSPYVNIPEQEEQYWRDQTVPYRQRLDKMSQEDRDYRAALVLNPELTKLDVQIGEAEKSAKALQGDDLTKKQKEIDDLKGQAKKLVDAADKKKVEELESQWKSDDAYKADAYRVTANVCSQCHSIGALKIKPENEVGPDLALAAERLRPEWTFQWIANPKRMFAYNTPMPQNFAKETVQFHWYLAGDSRDRARAARDLLMDLPRLENLQENAATRASIPGGK